MAKKAFLVGVNDYAPVGPGGPDLNGCVNDVKDMATTLTAPGFVPSNPSTLRICTNARATRANIMNGVKWLVTGAQSGDLLVFYYSGHGSQVADLEGDEIDKLDETICPHDFATAGMIKDDDLRQALAGVKPGVLLEVLFDSCHSGTATRNPTSGFTPRFIPPPLDYGFFLESNPLTAKRRLLRARPNTKSSDLQVVPDLNHVLWAACHDFQTSGETMIENSIRGMFTYAFCKVLRRAGTDIARQQLYKQVSAYMAQMAAAQVPELECTSAAMSAKVFA